jgi:flavin-dependent dehydrogenase
MISAAKTVQIAGAGPAGLAAAITLAGAGKHVLVHEAAATVGHRFRRDLQGLENWTTERDVLEVLGDLGIAPTFRYTPCCRGRVFDAWGEAHPVESAHPLFYLVERGSREGSLDTALLAQARGLGVEVRFGSRVRQLPEPAILATGPVSADAIAVGYHFDTSLPDGFWAICDDRIAPKGYAYLLVMDGCGTVKTCLFRGLARHRVFLERTVEAFRRLAGLEMREPLRHAGLGNFRIARPNRGSGTVVGERGGVQDALWGFGIRAGMLSGVLAARSLLDGIDYAPLWRREIEPLLRTSMFNRAAYHNLGNRGYRWCLNRQRGRDARDFLRRHCGPSPAKWLLGPAAWGLHRIQNAWMDRAR